MGLFDGVVGGIVGAEMASLVNGVIQKHGGLSGMVSQLEQQGLGPAVKSWIGTGANLPVTGDQMHRALGATTVAELAAKAGMTPEEFSAKLATVLPQVVDKMTPTGTLPA